MSYEYELIHTFSHFLSSLFLLAPKHFFQLFLLKFQISRISIRRYIRLFAGKQIIHQLPHFSFCKPYSGFNGLLSCQRTNQFFSFGKFYFIAEMFVLLQQNINNMFFISLFHISRCALYNKSIFPKRFNKIAE